MSHWEMKIGNIYKLLHFYFYKQKNAAKNLLVGNRSKMHQQQMFRVVIQQQHLMLVSKVLLTRPECYYCYFYIIVTDAETTFVSCVFPKGK
jgi:hypothetical protein